MKGNRDDMTSCHELRDYLLGQLDDPGRSAFEAHLESCPACRDEVAAWERVNGAVQTWSDARAVPETSPFVANRLVQVAREGRKPKITRRARSPLTLVAATAVAAAVAVVLVLYVTGGDPAVETAQPPMVEPVLVHAEGGDIRLDQQAREAVLRVEGDGRLVAAVEQDRVAIGGRSEARVSRVARGGLRIELVSGTVAVAAAKRESTQLLFVEAGTHRVEVVGTRFKVTLRRGGDLEVAVSEGVVEVIGDDGSSHRVSQGQLFELATRGEERIAALEEALARSVDELLADPDEVADEQLNEPVAEIALVEPSEGEVTDSGPEAQPASKPRPDAPVGTDLQEIKSWILAGELERAETALELHLRRHPRDVKAWELLANCRRKAGNFGDAVAGYRKVIEYGSAGQSNRARFIAASVLQDRMSRHGEAAALLEAYLDRPGSLKPLEAEAMVRLARAQLRTGRTGEARALLRQVLDRFPGTTAALQARRMLPAE